MTPPPPASVRAPKKRKGEALDRAEVEKSGGCSDEENWCKGKKQESRSKNSTPSTKFERTSVVQMVLANPVRQSRKHSFWEHNAGGSGLAIIEKAADCIAAEKETGKSHSYAMKGIRVGASVRVASYVNLVASSSESSEHSPTPRDVVGSLPSPLQDVPHRIVLSDGAALPGAPSAAGKHSTLLLYLFFIFDVIFLIS
jgi:hypothetical protein